MVLDGGSSDTTAEVVGKYVAADSRIHYFRQATNLGVDQDFDRAVQQANGEYCWLLSDDDLIKPGAVAKVLEALREGPSLVLVNAEVHNKDFSRWQRLHPCPRMALLAERYQVPKSRSGCMVRPCCATHCHSPC